MIRITESEGHEKYLRLQRQFKSENPLKDLNRIRFINKHIDKSDPNWALKNMIEVYDISVCIDAENTVRFTNHERYPEYFTDTGDDGLPLRRLYPEENPFIKPENAILEIFRPCLYEKYACEMHISDIYKHPELFMYDKKNNAYVVNDIKDIINNCNCLNPAYKKLPINIYEKLEHFSWFINYGYVRIKSEEQSVDNSESASAWL